MLKSIKIKLAWRLVWLIDCCLTSGEHCASNGSWRKILHLQETRKRECSHIYKFGNLLRIKRLKCILCPYWDRIERIHDFTSSMYYITIFYDNLILSDIYTWCKYKYYKYKAIFYEKIKIRRSGNTHISS